LGEAVKLTYISQAIYNGGEQTYYKADITDIGELRGIFTEDCEDWNEDDEVYMLATFTFKESYGGNEIGVIDCALYDYTLWENNQGTADDDVVETDVEIPENFEELLNGTKSMYLDITLDNMYLYDALTFMQYGETVGAYALTDLDLDGTVEMIVQLVADGNNTNRLVVDEQGGELYGYYFSDVDQYLSEIYQNGIYTAYRDDGKVYFQRFSFDTVDYRFTEVASTNDLSYFSNEEQAESIRRNSGTPTGSDLRYVIDGSDVSENDFAEYFSSNINDIFVRWVEWTASQTGEQVDEANDSGNIIEDDIESDTGETSKAKLDDVPYAGVKSNILGEDFMFYIDMHNMYGQECDESVMSQFGMQTDDVTYYMETTSGNAPIYYIGVKAGEIVSSCAYMNSATLKNVFTSEALLQVTPKRVNMYGGAIYLIWGLQNGYLIVKSYETTGSYLNNVVEWYAYIADADMNSYMEYEELPDGYYQFE
jgi:hypothetical protein